MYGKKVRLSLDMAQLNEEFMGYIDYEDYIQQFIDTEAGENFSHALPESIRPR